MGVEGWDGEAEDEISAIEDLRKWVLQHEPLRGASISSLTFGWRAGRLLSPTLLFLRPQDSRHGHSKELKWQRR